MSDDNKKPGFVERVGRAGALAAAVATPFTTSKIQAADAPPPPGVIVAGKIPNPTPEQFQFATNTSPNFAVEARDDGTYHLLIEANPKLPHPASQATVTQFANTTNAVAQSLLQGGFIGVNIAVEPVEVATKPNAGTAKLDENPSETVASAGTIRRPAAGESAFAAAGKGYKQTYVLDVLLESPDPNADPAKVVNFLADQYSEFRAALGSLGAAPAAPAVAAAPAQPAPPPPAPDADSFTLPAQLTVEQQRFFRNVNGFSIESDANGVATLKIVPDESISRFRASTRLKEWEQRAVPALTSMGFKDVKLADPNDTTLQRAENAPSIVMEPNKYRTVDLSPSPPSVTDGTLTLGDLAGAVVYKDTVIPTFTFKLSGGPNNPQSVNNAGILMSQGLTRFDSKEEVRQFDREEKQRERDAKAAQRGR